MRGLIAALAVLAGCAGPAALAPSDSYRNAGAPFSSIVLFDPVRFAGAWYVVAQYPVAGQAGCVAVQMQFDRRADGTFEVVNSCRHGASASQIKGTGRMIGPGRIDVQLDGADLLSAPYWVLWVDQGYRTAVVGVPSGRTGWILNRDPVIPPDRMAAAREILDFNGYDLSRLVRVGNGAQ